MNLPWLPALMPALPFYMRSGLHDLAVQDSRSALRAAAATGDFALASLCGELQYASSGQMCEPLIGDDLAEAEARLTLRIAGSGQRGSAFVDGDLFYPRDGRTPHVVGDEPNQRVRWLGSSQLFDAHAHLSGRVKSVVQQGPNGR